MKTVTEASLRPSFHLTSLDQQNHPQFQPVINYLEVAHLSTTETCCPQTYILLPMQQRPVQENFRRHRDYILAYPTESTT